MAKFEEGQTAEYWYERAERYRRQVGGMSSASSKLKHKIKVKNDRISELKNLVEEAYLLMANSSFEVEDDNEKARKWRAKADRFLKSYRTGKSGKN